MISRRRVIVTCVPDRAPSRGAADAAAAGASGGGPVDGGGALRHLRDVAPPALRARIAEVLRTARPTAATTPAR